MQKTNIVLLTAPPVARICFSEQRLIANENMSDFYLVATGKTRKLPNKTNLIILHSACYKNTTCETMQNNVNDNKYTIIVYSAYSYSTRQSNVRQHYCSIKIRNLRTLARDKQTRKLN